MVLVKLTLLVCLFGLSACQPVKQTTPYQWDIPEQFPKPIVPADNPMTDAKVQLGRHLFYDVNLSANQSQSCASCHMQQFAFAEPRETSVGSQGDVVRRNSLALVNVAYNGSLTWAHSGLTTLEQQILIPLFSEEPIELGVTGNEDIILFRFDSPQYKALFEAAFGNSEANFDYIVKALSSFVRSLVSFNSAFDRYAYAGDDAAISESAVRGLNLFFSERLECQHCHGGLNFTQSSKHDFQQLDLRPFHNIGLFNTDGNGAYPKSDQGLIEVTKEARDMGHFRAPTLRNIARTAPYFHNGSAKTLEDVVDHYARGGTGEGIESPLKSPFLKGFALTEEEKQDLVAFLHTLTDESFLTNPAFAAP